MKKFFACLIVVLSLSAIAHADEVITGELAEKTFNSLENQFEYKSGASISGLTIETIVRHDNGSVSCSKESVKYGDEDAVVTFECVLK